MSNIKKFCKHSDGVGHCELSGEYCVEGPCDNMEEAEYAEVVHGTWTHNRGGFWNVSTCSICGTHWPAAGGGVFYCPNCGARMDGGT